MNIKYALGGFVLAIMIALASRLRPVTPVQPATPATPVAAQSAPVDPLSALVVWEYYGRVGPEGDQHTVWVYRDIPSGTRVMVLEQGMRQNIVKLDPIGVQK